MAPRGVGGLSFLEFWFRVFVCCSWTSFVPRVGGWENRRAFLVWECYAIVFSVRGVVHSWFAGCLSGILDSLANVEGSIGYEAMVSEDI